MTKKEDKTMNSKQKKILIEMVKALASTLDASKNSSGGYLKQVAKELKDIDIDITQDPYVKAKLSGEKR